ncbi:MAG: hypothetical protein ACLFQL_00490, partial [Paracoccaceae bacterium]
REPGVIGRGRLFLAPIGAVAHPSACRLRAAASRLTGNAAAADTRLAGRRPGLAPTSRAAIARAGCRSGAIDEFQARRRAALSAGRPEFQDPT